MLLEDTSDLHLISYLGESVSEQKILFKHVQIKKLLFEIEYYKSADTDQDCKKDFLGFLTDQKNNFHIFRVKMLSLYKTNLLVTENDFHCRVLSRIQVLSVEKGPPSTATLSCWQDSAPF